VDIFQHPDDIYYTVSTLFWFSRSEIPVVLSFLEYEIILGVFSAEYRQPGEFQRFRGSKVIGFNHLVLPR
jgi:hypothetical protein